MDRDKLNRAINIKDRIDAVLYTSRMLENTYIPYLRRLKEDNQSKDYLEVIKCDTIGVMDLPRWMMEPLLEAAEYAIDRLAAETKRLEKELEDL